MARKGNPALIGAFVLGGIALAVAALIVFGGGGLFQRTQTMVAYFDGSLKGLAVGAPVTLNGVKIGSVTDVRIVVDVDKETFRTPVYFEIESKRLRDASGTPIELKKDAPALTRLIERGLRAQPELQSLVTGQLQVSLNFYPDTPVRLTNLSPTYPEMPTIPSSMERLSRTLENLPIEEMIADLRRTLDTVNTLVSSPEIIATIRGLQGTVASTDRLVNRVAAQIAPLMVKVDTVATGADATMAKLRQLATRLAPVAEATLKEYQQLGADVRAQIGPLTVTVAELAGSLSTTLEQAQQTMKSLETTIDADSPLRYDIARTLKELHLAARSLRGLTDYLEQYPEAVVSGKRGGTAQ
jgi:paraquat-inducible protein B